MTDLEEIPTRDPDFLVLRQRQNDFATYSYLTLPDRTSLWVILERPWVDKDGDGHRDRNKSRFVPGLYRLFRRISHIHGGDGGRTYDVWEYEDVPDVSNAQIHVANLPDELEGCQGIGTAFGLVQRPNKDPRPLPGIIGSAIAFGQFMQRTAGKTELWIRVVDEFTH